ncbi:hypothetical protein LI177_05380 [bacterium 210820-DFI.6.37]|nr:hypothetical protein [bacterium 210820-DFI.6.37]
MTKTEFVKQVGELLKETRPGKEIDHIYLDEDIAVIVYQDPRRLHRRASIAADSRLQIIKDIIRAIE